MSALHDLIAKELSAVGITAQDEVEDHDKWMEISDELSLAWRHLYGKRYEEAAEHAKKARSTTERTINEERS